MIIERHPDSPLPEHPDDNKQPVLQFLYIENAIVGAEKRVHDIAPGDFKYLIWKTSGTPEFSDYCLQLRNILSFLAPEAEIMPYYVISKYDG